jgi:hypothetical protein
VGDLNIQIADNLNQNLNISSFIKLSALYCVYCFDVELHLFARYAGVLHGKS